MLFTHFGVSGPLILTASSFVGGLAAKPRNQLGFHCRRMYLLNGHPSPGDNSLLKSPKSGNGPLILTASSFVGGLAAKQELTLVLDLRPAYLQRHPTAFPAA